MRDAKWTTKGATRCPHSSTLGYSRCEARSGDWISWDDCNDPGFPRSGRVLGRLTEMPNDGLENCVGWLAVYAMSTDMSYGYIRWVNPEWVRMIQDLDRIRNHTRIAMESTPEQLFEMSAF